MAGTEGLSWEALAAALKAGERRMMETASPSPDVLSRGAADPTPWPGDLAESQTEEGEGAAAESASAKKHGSQIHNSEGPWKIRYDNPRGG